MTSQTWTVQGMTCAHCVASVTEEVSELPGVRRVHVVLDGGRLTVEADAPLADDDVRTAVEEAGYRLV
jgi:copper chaperone